MSSDPKAEKQLADFDKAVAKNQKALLNANKALEQLDKIIAAAEAEISKLKDDD